MRLLSRVFFVAVALMFSWPQPVVIAGQNAQVVTRIAKVGNMIITQTDIDRRAQKLLPMQVSFHGGIDKEKVAEIKQNALDELISRAYKVQYAIDGEISIDATDFENEWKNKLSKNSRLADNVHTAQASKIKADLYLDMLASKAEMVAVEEKITVTDQEVAAYYAKNKEKYFRPKLFTASHIFVKVDPSDNAEEKKVKRARAEKLMKRAQAGEDFYNLAYYESDDRSKYVGGSLGSFHAGQTVPEFDAAIHAMKPGDIVGPVRTMYGFHVIKLDAVDDERQLALDEVAAKIRVDLEKTQREQLYEQWMAKLKEKYSLERFDQ